ncbi:serine hydrolase domain-containing protein [Pseudoalteromonas sp. T1lg65]|uniref:serine hydrolase domain-containing protein n=1 Tax=Pseudoalteromonas sp. T1lg65 TaxID=2077101 RepID=UPI003F7B25AC
MQQQVDNIVNAFVNRTKPPQLDIAVWNNGAQYRASFGNDNDGQADVFEIGSVGKTLTTSLLLILAEQGVVNIDDRIGKFRPDLPILKDVTLKQLATHTSGLPANPISTIGFSENKVINNILDFSHSDLDAFLQSIKKPPKPGKFNYSNLGMALLGNLLADLLGVSYEQAVQTSILQPLKMTDTYVNSSAYKSQRLVKGHRASGCEVADFQWRGMEPAGVWRSTVDDMLLFLKAHLGCTGESWKERLSEATAPTFAEPKFADLGLAWALGYDDELGQFAWHNGGTFGQHSMVMICKEKNMAIVLLTNKAPKLWHGFFSNYRLESLAKQVMLEVLQSSG